MRNRISLFVGGLLLACSAAAWAAPPEYKDDAFEDNDFISPPLIVQQAFPTSGRFEIGLLFASNAIDKYSTHYGAALDINYHFLETFGVGATFTYLHGMLTGIVTSPKGVLGNNVDDCIQTPATCVLNPNVPDYKQLTSALSFNAMWAPLYGKISVVSEINLNLQIYALAGGGIVGRRTVVAQLDPGTPQGYRLEGNGPGEGGLFQDLSGHGMAGLGFRLFILDWLNVRAEFRTLIYADEFDSDQDGSAEGRAALAYLAQIGVGFVPFRIGD